ncbi:MAG: peptide-methionine (S)-S-oxide reductase [Synergistaceae bacterium]|jgi:peptide methionine sulfoxide reductase MsrA|nr:peptide-methionine (S)-S-oxide reductase [Synergistaceae bacterium]
MTEPSVIAAATFGWGCFLDYEPRFGAARGVLRTSVGYCGGEQAEAVMVEYDPYTVSYGELLEIALGDFEPEAEGSSLACPKRRRGVFYVFVSSEREDRLARAAIARHGVTAYSVLYGRGFVEAGRPPCERGYILI